MPDETKEVEVAPLKRTDNTHGNLLEKGTSKMSHFFTLKYVRRMRDTMTFVTGVCLEVAKSGKYASHILFSWKCRKANSLCPTLQPRYLVQQSQFGFFCHLIEGSWRENKRNNGFI